MKEKFIQFLKDEGAYEKFIEAYSADPDPYSYGWEEFIDMRVQSTWRLVCGAFIWENTKDGHGFWEEVESKWLNIIDEKG